MGAHKFEFEFVGELPPKRSNRRDYVLDAFAEALRSRPGEWAVWPKVIERRSALTYVSVIPRGKLAAFPACEFEAAWRSDVLYVRYIGEGL